MSSTYVDKDTLIKCKNYCLSLVDVCDNILAGENLEKSCKERGIDTSDFENILVNINFLI